MFRYIKLKNYKSLTDITFDFTGKNKVPKNLIILYGENGAGKTNIISVLDTLHDTFNTLNINKIVMQLLEENTNELDAKEILSLKAYTDISSIIKRAKTNGSETNMSIEVGFYLREKPGVYLIEFDNKQIVHERLEFVLNKNKGVYFDIKKNIRKINNAIFSSRYIGEFGDMVDKFWGKHSALSILINAKEEYSKEFFNNSISQSMRDVINYMKTLSCYLVSSGWRSGVRVQSDNLLENFVEGRIADSKKELKILEKTQKLISNYYMKIYRDIKDVYYKIEKNDNTIHYNLCFKKMISGKELDIDFRQESCGTKNLLGLLPYFLAATNEGIVAIDEIDNGIHDILLSNLVKNLAKDINGQVILTTHNTMLMHEYEFKDNIYFIVKNSEGEKKIQALTDFGYRVQPDSNVFAKYIKGTFGGAPWSDVYVDFKELHMCEVN